MCLHCALSLNDFTDLITRLTENHIRVMLRSSIFDMQF